jgi:hypothetical protein
LEIAREQAKDDALQAELRQEAEVLVIDVKKAELLAQKVLRQHSVRLKVAFSELVVQTVEDLRSPGVRAKDRALALASLRGVCDRLYGWDREPDLHTLKIAETAAININLQNTSPEKLRQMALAKYGSLTPEHDGQGVGPGPMMSEQPDAVGNGPLGEKGDPEKLAEKKQGDPDAGVDHCVDHDHHDQDVSARSPKDLKPELDEILRPQVGLAPRQSAQDAPKGNPPWEGSPPLPPQERREQQLEELARLRAEWRGRPFNSLM